MNNYYSFFNKIIKSALDLSPLVISKSKNHDIEVREIEKKKILKEDVKTVDVQSNDNLDFIDFGKSDNYFVINYISCFKRNIYLSW